MAKVKEKTCTVTGLTLPTSDFYINETQQDNLHPYCKEVDNYRRVTEFTTPQLRRAFNAAYAIKGHYQS
jgi:hypothetical protein